MKINEVMTNAVNRVTPETAINETATMMRQDDIGALPVEKDDKLVGMVTDRDIVTRILGNVQKASDAKVSDAMTEEVLYCFEDDDVANVAENMSAKQVRRMPVVDHDKRLVGIVSLGDIACNARNEVSGEALEGISENGA